MEDRIAIQQQVLRCNGGADAGSCAGDELHGLARRDVLEHDFQSRETFCDAYQHAVDEDAFAVEYVDLGIGHLTVNLEDQSAFLHGGQRRKDVLDVRDACIGMSRCARGIELGTDDDAAGARRENFLRRGRICQVQRHQRFETMRRRNSPQDALPIGGGLRNRGHGRFQVRHDHRARELTGGKWHDAGKLCAVAHVQMPVVGAEAACEGAVHGDRRVATRCSAWHFVAVLSSRS